MSAATPDAVTSATGLDPARLARLADEFGAASSPLAVAGGIAAQHRGAIDLCHAVNQANIAAGGLGRTVVFGADSSTTDGYGVIQEAFAAMDRGGWRVLRRR